MADEKELTKRSILLLKVLDCINRDEFEDFEKYLIFGGKLEDLLEAVDHPGQKARLDKATEILESVKEVAADFVTRGGRNAAMRRAALDQPGKQQAIKGFDRLDHALPGAADAYRQALDMPPGNDNSQSTHEQEMDKLDAYFARQVLGKLSKIVRRISRLDNLNIQGIPNGRVRRYFEEAHNSFLYGFPLACAVHCRAILESALQETINLHRSRERAGAPQPATGDTQDRDKLKFLIDGARGTLLTSDGAACAHDVRKAGNWAIHDPDRFDIVYGGERLYEVLANARKVLQELYGPPELSV